jgi:hypothetical protein
MTHPPVQSELFGEIEAVLREYHFAPSRSRVQRRGWARVPIATPPVEQLAASDSGWPEKARYEDE